MAGAPIRYPGPLPIPRGNVYGLQRPNQHGLALGQLVGSLSRKLVRDGLYTAN